MKRVIKQAISGIALVCSVIAILLIFDFEAASDNSYGIIILPFVTFFLSVVAFVSYSENGWSDLATGLLLGPTALWFKKKDSGDQSRKDARMDQKKDEEYYKQRPK